MSAIGKYIYLLDEVDSTNNLAWQLAEKAEETEAAPEGLVVCASVQQQGRGRLQRNWISPPKEGLYFSIILRPASFLVKDLSVIPILSGLATAEAIEDLTEYPCYCKWPNDLMMSSLPRRRSTQASSEVQYKVGGILCEAHHQGSTLDNVIVGIGVNINMEAEFFQKLKLEEASSLFLITGKKYDLEKLLSKIIDRFGYWYEKFQMVESTDRPQQKKEIISAWKSRSQTIGKDVSVITLNGKIIGKATDLDDDGNLILIDDTGKKIKINAGDVQELRNRSI